MTLPWALAGMAPPLTGAAVPCGWSFRPSAMAGFVCAFVTRVRALCTQPCQRPADYRHSSSGQDTNAYQCTCTSFYIGEHMSCHEGVTHHCCLPEESTGLVHPSYGQDRQGRQASVLSHTAQPLFTEIHTLVRWKRKKRRNFIIT